VNITSCSAVSRVSGKVEYLEIVVEKN